MNWDQIKKLIGLKAKFATTSVIATAVEYLLYTIFRFGGMDKQVGQIISYSCGMIVNFLLQKRFVFDLKRSVSKAFILAMLVSLGGMALNFTIFSLLLKLPFFEQYDYLAKLCATGLVFFYNFYLKRFVFEKRFFTVD